MARIKSGRDLPADRLRAFNDSARGQMKAAVNAANSVPALRQQVAELVELVAALRNEVERLRG